MPTIVSHERVYAQYDNQTTRCREHSMKYSFSSSWQFFIFAIGLCIVFALLSRVNLVKRRRRRRVIPARLVIGYVATFPGVSLQNCTAGPFASGNGGGTSRQRLLELSHGLGALRHYNDLANHVLSLNQQGAVVTKLLGKFSILVPKLHTY